MLPGLGLALAVTLWALPARAESEIRITVIGLGGARASVTLAGPGDLSQTVVDEDGDGEVVVTPNGGPGSYRVTIAAGGQSETTSVDVKQDASVHLTYRGDLPAGSRISLAFEEEVVVTADRMPTKLTAIPHSVTIVGQLEIQQQAALTIDLGKILAQQVPGLGVSSSSFSNFDITMRGRKPVILIDGVPTSTLLRDGGRDLRAISPSAIERVDVIRGSTAAYGMGGAGGLINYITKRPGAGKPSFHLDAGVGGSLTHFGDSQRFVADTGVQGKSGRFDYVVNASFEPVGSFFDAEGDRIAPDPQGQGGLADTDTFDGFGKLGVDLGDRQRLELGFNYFGTEQDTKYAQNPGVFGVRKATAMIGTPDPRAVNQKTDNAVGTLRYTHRDVLGMEVNVQGLYQDYRTIFSYFAGFPALVPGGAPGGQSLIDSDKKGIRFDAVRPLKLGRTSTLLWGFDWVRDQTIQAMVDGRDWTPPMDLKNYAGFAQMEVSASERLTLRGGLRYEYLDLAVDTWTLLQGPRAGRTAEGGTLIYDDFIFNGGAVVFLNERNQVFAGYSQGFSAAEVGRVLRNANVTRVPDYKPGAQTIDNYELGLRNRFGKVRATVSGFISTSDLGSQYNQVTLTVDRAKEKIKGVEATLDADVSPKWRLGGSFTWSDGDRDSNGDGVLDQPLDTTRINPLKLTGFIDWRARPSWLLRLQGLYSGSQDRFPEQTTPLFARNKQSSFFLLDLLAAVDVGPGRLTLGFDNLLNRDYYAPSSERFGSGANYAKAPGATATLRYRVKF